MDPFVPSEKKKKAGWKRDRGKRWDNETEEARSGKEGDAKMKMKGLEYDRDSEMEKEEGSRWREELWVKSEVV